jgi:hypothetical protein
MILGVAFRAVERQFAAGHGDKRAVGTFDDLQIADHKAIVEGDGTESLQSFTGLIHQFDSNLGNFHA